MGIYKIFIVVLIGMKLLNIIDCDLLREKVEPNPDYPDQCWDEEAERAYPVGSTWSKSGRCMEFSCVQDFDGLFINGHGCPVQMMTRSQECKRVVKKPQAPYPGCCPLQICQRSPCDTNLWRTDGKNLWKRIVFKKTARNYRTTHTRKRGSRRKLC